jgi:hypothetical protein
MIWVLGICLLPLVGWLSGDWFTFGLITCVPLGFIFIYFNILPESPRWLLTVGRVKEAEEVITEIARKNGTLENIGPGEVKRMLGELRMRQDKAEHGSTQGVWSLFSKRRIAKYTILLAIVW